MLLLLVGLFLVFGAADHVMIPIPGEPQTILGIFQPRDVGCGFVFTTSVVLYFVGPSYNFTARYDVSSLLTNPTRSISSVALFEKSRKLFAVVADSHGWLFECSVIGCGVFFTSSSKAGCRCQR